ncbi:hypothetical protein SAY86_025137 [Trapa natans]|uniref:Uncharacterized protein n=1 Tax=Trapa natans TaxID=22666 RepID=A0AAN7RDX6_TRANT|nr:hypothetical protein SAY86_025137 [Trapa natans]
MGVPETSRECQFQSRKMKTKLMQARPMKESPSGKMGTEEGRPGVLKRELEAFVSLFFFQLIPSHRVLRIHFRSFGCTQSHSLRGRWLGRRGGDVEPVSRSDDRSEELV